MPYLLAIHHVPQRHQHSLPHDTHTHTHTYTHTPQVYRCAHPHLQSNGSPMRIHISMATHGLLQEAGGFMMEPRGGAWQCVSVLRVRGCIGTTDSLPCCREATRQAFCDGGGHMAASGSGVRVRVRVPVFARLSVGGTRGSKRLAGTVGCGIVPCPVMAHRKLDAQQTNARILLCMPLLRMHPTHHQHRGALPLQRSQSRAR